MLNLKSTPEALPYYLASKNVKLFTSHNVYTESEINARYLIGQEHYSKIVNIEALTVVDMLDKDYLPAISSYSKKLVDAAIAKASVGIPADYELETAKTLSNGLNEAIACEKELKAAIAKAQAEENPEAKSMLYRNSVLALMEKVRDIIDSLEGSVEASAWPVPSYGDLLYGVR